jgi:asparaginyl-tRNA synthetase
MVIEIKNAAQHLGQEVEIRGWSFNVRSSGSIAFVQLRDGSGRLQAVVVKNDVSPELWETVKSLTIESSVIVTGTVKEDGRKPGTYEIATKNVTLVGSSPEFPIGKKEHGPDFLMDVRHLWLRSSRQEAIIRVRDEIAFAMREFMKERGFTLTDSPIFTPNAVEGTSDLFEVKYFDDKAYLSQSGQLYLEATSAALGKTYCFGPTFRSEKSKTRRHLTEFWMLEAEASYMDWEQNIQLQEDMVVHILKRVLRERRKDLELLERNIPALEKVAEGGFIRMHHADAVKELQAMGSDIKERDDFGADDETILTKKYDKPIFIHHYPVEVKAFYMKPDPNEPDRALNADMLAPEGYGEVIGGSQRIDDLALLEKRIEEHGLPKSAFEWYLDIRRYGSVPHSGFGIGLERTVAWICGLEHVRETIPFPRLLNRLTP